MSHWKPTPHPLRRVIKTDFYSDKHCRPGEGRNIFTLECGHTVGAKLSEGYPLKKRCRDCAMGRGPE